MVLGVCISSLVSLAGYTFDGKFIYYAADNETNHEDGTFTMMWNGMSFTHDNAM